MKQSYFKIFYKKFYNAIYKNFIFLFCTGIIRIFFKKKNILSKEDKQNNLSRNFLLDDQNLNDLKFKNNEFYIQLGTFNGKGQIVSDFSLKLKNKVSKSSNISQGKFSITLVLLRDGRLGVKKNHKSYPVFFRELFAMTSLVNSTNINIPKIFDYSVKEKYFIMEYIDGLTLRNLAANNEVKEKLKNLSVTEEYKSGNLATRVKLITKIEKPNIHRVIKKDLIRRIEQDYHLMLKKRFVYQDIRYPNFVIFQNKVYWLDFEHCYYHPFASDALFKIISNQYNNKIKKFFYV